MPIITLQIKLANNFWSSGRAVSTRLIHYDEATEKSCIRIVQVQLTYEFVSVRGHIYLEPFFWVCTLKLWPSLHFTSILLGRKNDLPHGLKGRCNRATRAFANLFWGEVLSIPLFNRSQRRFIRLMNPTKKLAKVDIYLLYICKHNYRCCRSWFTLFYQIKFMFTTWQ